MKKKSETVVFFGSGPVAAKSLELLSAHFEIEAVITKPRPVHHKGPVPVIELSESLDIPLFTSNTKKELDNLINEQKFKSTLGILIDFGVIVSAKTIDYFPLGIVNSHFSLLPEWRGADPITFSILSGQEKTGVSLMLLVEAMDEGPIIGFGEVDISNTTDSKSLTQRLIYLSDALLDNLVPEYMKGCITPAPQPKTGATYSRKLTKDDGTIDWRKPAEVINREVRAFVEWPKSTALIADKQVIITKAHIKDLSGNPGKAVNCSKELLVFCGEQALVIDRLKPTGKKEMTGREFIAGHHSTIPKLD